MISVSINITGLAEALGAVEKLQEIVSDFSAETQKIGDYLLGFLSGEVFDSEGSVYGSSWAALSEPYASYKAKMWGAQKILVASGAMRTGYKLYTSTDYLIVKNEATNAQGDFYAGYHQDGTSKMPQRILIKMDDDRLSKIIEIVVKSLAERLLGL